MKYHTLTQKKSLPKITTRTLDAAKRLAAVWAFCFFSFSQCLLFGTRRRGSLIGTTTPRPPTIEAWNVWNQETILLQSRNLMQSFASLEQRCVLFSGLKPTMHVVWRRLHCTNSRVQSRIIMKRLVSHSLSGYGPCLNCR